MMYIRYICVVHISEQLTTTHLIMFLPSPVLFIILYECLPLRREFITPNEKLFPLLYDYTYRMGIIHFLCTLNRFDITSLRLALTFYARLNNQTKNILPKMLC